jgi:hypothetical protein
MPSHIEELEKRLPFLPGNSFRKVSAIYNSGTRFIASSKVAGKLSQIPLLRLLEQRSRGLRLQAWYR